MNNYHQSVLLESSISGLNIQPNGTYVDATFGGGGHSRMILKKLFGGKLFAFDMDNDCLVNRIGDDDRFKIVKSNFKYINKNLFAEGVKLVDGIIADLGVSSFQFSDNGRGFSIKFDAPLDMRMDVNSKIDAKYVVNNYSKIELNKIFKEHSDFKKTDLISQKIINKRRRKRIETTFELINIFSSDFESNYGTKFFARLFQAIRIEVNDELNSLRTFLIQTKSLLKRGGRLVVISYHSHEDRLVKKFMNYGSFLNIPEKDFFGNQKIYFKQLTKKPITPSKEELFNNNKSRSAKLRICEKI
tara:strand:- start:7321 stop:8223 length:903 start_codon:yes stop_codon:yes gene_type:complete